MIGKLDAVCKLYNLGKINSYLQETSSQNKVYQVITNKGIYIIKEYSHDAIKNYYHLNKRKKQIYICEILNYNGINCILPIKRKNKYFTLFNKHYYLVYPFKESKHLNISLYTKRNLKILAKTQADIHNLRIISNLPCSYKKININLKKYIKKYPFLKDYEYELTRLIEEGNKRISLVKNNLCISHNDYKGLNILWDKNTPILLDFDAVGLVNPMCAMAESAFVFSYSDNRINFENYKIYIKEYLNRSDKTIGQYLDILYTCMNGKLQWLNYLLSIKDEEGIKSMVMELSTYYKNINKLYQIYLSI